MIKTMLVVLEFSMAVSSLAVFELCRQTWKFARNVSEDGVQGLRAEFVTQPPWRRYALICGAHILSEKLWRFCLVIVVIGLALPISIPLALLALLWVEAIKQIAGTRALWWRFWDQFSTPEYRAERLNESMERTREMQTSAENIRLLAALHSARSDESPEEAQFRDFLRPIARVLREREDQPPSVM